MNEMKERRGLRGGLLGLISSYLFKTHLYFIKFPANSIDTNKRLKRYKEIVF